MNGGRIDRRHPEIKLHHIGVVVKDAIEAGKLYRELVPGALDVNSEHVESQRVNICMMRSNCETVIEFISPADEDSPVSLFLKNGGGLHHFCYETDDIDTACVKLKPHLRKITNIFCGFEGRKCAFFWVKNPMLGMSLIEITETDKCISGEDHVL